VQAAEARTVELTVEDCEVVGQSLATEEQIVLVKDDVTLRVSRDTRGRCKVSVTSVGRSTSQLREIADEFVQKLTQMYVYNKVMTELRNKGFTVVSETVAEDDTVHIHVRQQVV
jgi:ABC-type transporter MlaC component